MKELVDWKALSIILCTDSVKKTRFLAMLADMAPRPVSYLDIDLLYAGCVRAGLCKRRGHITITCPDQETWHEDLVDVISASSAEKTIVVIDSLNGAYEMFGGPDAAMSANAQIMAVASLARQAGSSVIAGARAGGGAPKGRGGGEKKISSAHDAEEPGAADDDSRGRRWEWTTRPGGRQIPGMVARTYLLGGTRAAPSLARIASQP